MYTNDWYPAQSAGADLWVETRSRLQVRVWVDNPRDKLALQNKKRFAVTRTSQHDKTQMKVCVEIVKLECVNKHNNSKSLRVDCHPPGARSEGAQKWPKLMSLKNDIVHVAFSQAVRVQRNHQFWYWCKNEKWFVWTIFHHKFAGIVSNEVYIECESNVNSRQNLTPQTL